MSRVLKLAWVVGHISRFGRCTGHYISHDISIHNYLPLSSHAWLSKPPMSTFPFLPTVPMPCPADKRPLFKFLESAQCLCPGDEHTNVVTVNDSGSLKCAKAHVTHVPFMKSCLFHQSCLTCSHYLDGAPKPGARRSPQSHAGVAYVSRSCTGHISND